MRPALELPSERMQTWLARRAAALSKRLIGLVVVLATAGCGSDGSNLQAGPGDVRDYDIDVFVESAGDFGALQLEITHLGYSGGFIGRSDQVECQSLVEAIMAANHPAERVVKVGLISLHGIVTPGAILRCGFRTSDELEPDDFLIEVLDAADTNSSPVVPVPTVIVSTTTLR